jgi:hypothetical protein
VSDRRAGKRIEMFGFVSLRWIFLKRESQRIVKMSVLKQLSVECMRVRRCCLCRMGRGARNNASVSRLKNEAVPRSRSICGPHRVLPMSLALHAIPALQYLPHAKLSTLPPELLQPFRHIQWLLQKRLLPRQMKPEDTMSYETP